MPKLYELTTAYREVWNMVEDDTTDLTVITDTLESIEGAIEEKAANIANFIRSLDYDAEAIKAEEKRLADRRKAIENRIAAIKRYIQCQMESTGIDKIKTPTQTISLQKNPPALVVSDDKAVPPQYLVVIPEHYEVDKTRIKEALKNGEIVPGCELTQGKSLRIR
jgi:hypothetical protein